MAVLIAAVHVQEGARDVYKWMLDKSKGFSVKGCYELMSFLRFAADIDADFLAAVQCLWDSSCRSVCQNRFIWDSRKWPSWTPNPRPTYVAFKYADLESAPDYEF